ncbi:peptidyl tRNA hydrolase [Microbacterium phage Zooman]|nr:peptidyl tRNA hydrolase [Microbacterium phage Zooman]
MDLNDDVLDRLREMYAAWPNSATAATDPEKITLAHAVQEIERLRLALNPPHGKPEKLRIYLNRSLRDKATTNKLAAHAVHAALQAFGVHPGVKVIVLDAGPTKIEQMRVAIHDAGHTELEPGTLTAGTNWPQDSED